MNIALYVRVSTEDQHPENQLQALKADAARRGWTIVKTYVDKGWSGTTTVRPSLTRLLKDATKTPRAFDAVMVWKLDRLARSVMDLATINETLDKAGVGFISLTEQFDLTTPHGKLLRTILSGFAQFERDILSERTKLGMERARRAGKHIGRPRKKEEVNGLSVVSS